MRPTAALCRTLMLGTTIVSAPATALAATVLWQFGGVITQTFDPGTVPLGTTFSGTFSYESTLSPDFTTTDEAGYSFGSLSEGTLAIDIGGFLGFATDGSNVGLGLSVLGNFEQCESFTGPDLDCDGYDVFDGNSVVSDNGEPTAERAEVAFKLFDTSQTAVTSFALPTAAPSLALFDDAHVAIFSTGPTPIIVGEITTLVPEPSTATLVVFGVGLLGAARRRRARARFYS